MAIDACSFLLSSSFQTEDSVYRCLVAGVVVLYGQLFKRVEGIGRVDLVDELVPDQGRETHEQLILMRDKMVAHRDLDGVYTRYGRANQLYLLLTPTSYGWMAPDATSIDKGSLSDVLDFIKGLKKRIDWQIEKREHALEGFMRRLPPGQYRLVLDMEPASLEKLQDHELFSDAQFTLNPLP
jgi:hypothetical protein